MAFEAAWPARPRLGARSGRSGSLTAVARARSASLGSSGLPLGLGRTCSKLAAHPLGFAEVNVFAATRSGANKNIRKHCARVTMVLERCDCLLSQSLLATVTELLSQVPYLENWQQALRLQKCKRIAIYCGTPDSPTTLELFWFVLELVPVCAQKLVLRAPHDIPTPDPGSKAGASWGGPGVRTIGPRTSHWNKSLDQVGSSHCHFGSSWIKFEKT